MKLTIQTKTDMPLVNRQEIVAAVDFDKEAAPSNVQMTEQIAKLAKAESELVVVKKLDTRFGQSKGTVTAYVYKTAEDKKRFETQKPKSEKKPEGEAAAPAPAAEPKKEAKK